MMFLSLEFKIIATQLIWAAGCFLIDWLIRNRLKSNKN